MSFKIHLIIIAMIAIVVYFIQKTFQTMPEPEPAQVAQPSKNDQFSISVTHASWGLNCKDRYRYTQGNDENSAFMSGDSDKLREDNVLAKISDLCNGKLQCDMTVDTATLGSDPAPTCGDKTLQIEYRCFSYDRPWNKEAPTGGALSINCSRN